MTIQEKSRKPLDDEKIDELLRLLSNKVIDRVIEDRKNRINKSLLYKIQYD